MGESKAEKKKRCSGCRDDFYNHGGGGADECWLLKTAKEVKKVRVGTWQTPPYRWVPEITNSCHSPDGDHWLDRSDSRVVADTDEAVEKWKSK